jgi:zinc and cadmium transporter
MANAILYALVSVIIVSAVSLVGIFTFLFNQKNLSKIVLYLVSFSVGALFGDVFIHLLPQAFKDANQGLIGIYIMSGIVFSFIVEKFIRWRHCHIETSKQHIHPFAYVNLIGDAMHNFIDGLVIAGAYFVSVPAGIATTIAIVLHEIPHEVGNFGVLIHGGFSRGKALFLNFVTALAALLGAIIGLVLSGFSTTFTFLIPFAAGNLIYIAGTDLIPELHKDSCENISGKKNVLQLFMMILGTAMMLLLLLTGG